MTNFFVDAFHLILYQPLFNVLVLLYEYLPGRDFGLAIIALTILIRLILHPFGVKAILSQRAMSELQPKIQEIQQKHKEDKAKQTQALMELYKKAKINPFSGCLPLLVQLPILIALYRLFWKGFEPEQMTYLYSFVANPGPIDTGFLGIMDLAKPYMFFAIFAGVLQFFQTKMTMSKKPREQNSKTLPSPPQFNAMLQKQMLYFFPGFTVLILWNLPSAIGLYWSATTLISILQQYLILKNYPS